MKESNLQKIRDAIDAAIATAGTKVKRQTIMRLISAAHREETQAMARDHMSRLSRKNIEMSSFRRCCEAEAKEKYKGYRMVEISEDKISIRLYENDEMVKAGRILERCETGRHIHYIPRNGIRLELKYKHGC